MFCLRSWLPLLFIPTNASPLFVVTFFVLTYFLNRPCVYCSILLLILFVSSCHWSDHCFFDFGSSWFEPRHLSSPLPNPIGNVVNDSSGTSSSTPGMSSFLATTFNNTAAALAGAAMDEVKRRMETRSEWNGIGLEWVRSVLGKREWRIPCVDVLIRL